MKFKGTMVWAIVLAVLAAFVYLYEIKGGRQRQAELEEAKKLLPVETGEVVQLTLRRPQETIVCRRSDGDWEITEPIETAGDQATIERILQTLAQAQRYRTVADSAADLSRFGLDPPQVTMEIQGDEGMQRIVQLGQKNPVGSHIYVRLGDRPTVYLTGSQLLTQAQTELFQLRDRQVLAFQQPEVNGVMLLRDGQTIELARDPQGWSIKKPLQVKADTDKIDGMLRKLGFAQVEEYVAEAPADLSPWGLDRPELSVTLVLGPEAAHKTLLIGDPAEDGRYARDVSRDPVFIIQGDLFQELDADLFDLRDKAVLDFQKERVAELELRSAESTIICRKDSSGQWILAVPESTAADRWEVETMINTLAGLQAEQFVDQDPDDLGRYGLSSPTQEAILRDDAGEQIAWLRLGRKAAEGVYACNAAGRPVVLVNLTTLTALSPKPADLKKKEAATP